MSRLVVMSILIRGTFFAADRKVKSKYHCSYEALGRLKKTKGSSVFLSFVSPFKRLLRGVREPVYSSWLRGVGGLRLHLANN